MSEPWLPLECDDDLLEDPEEFAELGSDRELVGRLMKTGSVTAEFFFV